MAILFDATGEYLSRTATAIDFNSAYTLAGWIKRTVTDSTFHLVIYVDAGTNYNNCDYVILNWFNDPAFGLAVTNGGSSSGNTYGSHTLAQDTYTHIAMVRESATSLKLYVNAALEVTVTTDITGRGSATRMSMADLPAGGQPPTGLVLAAWNAWNRALDATELASQMAFAAPTNSTSLWAEWLMLAAGQGTDASGNARHWTVNGAPTNVTDPSITYPGAPSATGYMTLNTGYWGTP